MTASELVLTPSEMRQVDLEAMARGTPGIELMRRAGRGVAVSAEKLASPGGTVAILCGPGQNGGDGFVAATILAERGYPDAQAVHTAEESLIFALPPELRRDLRAAARG